MTVPTPNPDEIQGQVDDPAFLDALKAGRAEAYARLVRDQGGRMYAAALRIMGREDDARDAVQDAFLSVVRSIGRFDGNSRLSTWLHRIVVNSCLMRLRTRKRRPEGSIEELLPRFDEKGHREQPAWNPTPEDGIERDRLRHEVREAIGNLPDTYREVLVLRDLEGLDTEATAHALGLTPGAVKTRLHRARQALRTLLEPRMTGDRVGAPPGSGGSRP